MTDRLLRAILLLCIVGLMATMAWSNHQMAQTGIKTLEAIKADGARIR